MAGSNKAVWAIAAGVVLITTAGGAALLYARTDGFSKGSAASASRKSELARYATGPLAALETPAELIAATDHPFFDRDGRQTTLQAFKGKVVVVNTWAMWCAPCRTEMPTLAALATAYADRDDFMVLPVNVDVDEDALADAKSFIDVHEPLPLYTDPTFKLPFLFPGQGGMPKTVLLDRQGRVRAVFTGEADWSSAEARALVDALLAEG